MLLTSFAFAADTPTYSAVHAIFSKHCLACHDAKEAEGELVMDSLEKLMAGGESGKVIVPGKPDQSLLVTLIEQKKKPFMPPPKKDRKLTDEQIDLIKRWIAAGAKADEAGGEQPAKPVKLPRVAPIGSPRDPVNVLRWSPEKQLAAAGRFGAVELRDLEGATVRKLGLIRGNVHDVVFLNGGAQLAAAGGDAGVRGQITIWDTATGKLIRTLEGHTDSVYCLAAGADGKLLASGSYDQMIHLWNLETGAEIRGLKGHNGAVYCLSMRPDGKVLASASADRTVKLWDLATGKRLDTLSQPTRDQQAVIFNPDGRLLAAAGADNRIRLWAISDTAREGSNKLLESRFAHEGAILRLSWSHDGQWLASSAEDKSVKIWNAASGELRSLLPVQPDWPAGLCLAAGDQQIIVGRLDGSIQRYDLATAKPLSAAPAPIDAAAIATATGKKAANKKAAEKKAAKAMTPAAPQITAIEPRGIERGKTARVKLTGTKLASPQSVAVASGKAAVKLESSPEPTDAAVWITVEIPADAAPGPVELSLKTAAGVSNKFKLHIDDLPQSTEKEPNDSPASATVMTLPIDQWGLLAQRGDVDRYAFEGKAGQVVVFDVAAGRIDSKADLQLTLNDPAGNLLQPQIDVEDDIDPLMSYRLPADGRYVLTVRDRELGASPDHFYRLSAGSLPVATGIHPLGIPVGKPVRVQLIGINLPAEASVEVTAGEAGDAAVPVEKIGVRSRKPLKALASAMNELLSTGSNHSPKTAMALPVPGAVNGRILPGAAGVGEADYYRITAKKGENWVIETFASRRGSPIDTRLEVLHPDGKPVQRLLLRAVRDSSITFRPIDATNKGARLINWEEMSLNEYLYMQGEVVRLFLAPRGPDSEYDFYTIGGKRRTYFDTSSTAHALDEPAYIVQPLPPGAQPSPNGLPTFPLYYANDDDQLRRLGSDSQIHFTAPADGDYLVRVTDARGFGADRLAYRLAIRPAAPNFSAVLNFGAITAKSASQTASMRSEDAPPPSVVTIPAGSGLSFDVNVTRVDEFDGPIRIDISGLPSGFQVSSPIIVEAGHVTATGVIYVPADMPKTAKPLSPKVRITATAEINGKTVKRNLTGFGSLAVGDKPKLMPSLNADAEGKKVPSDSQMPVITITPGQLTPAWLTVARNGFEERVSFDLLNMPHGSNVADIGLNGVLITEKQTERRIFIQCDPWVADQDRIAYARTREDGNRATRPVLIQVRRSPSQASR